ncbi:MAG: sialidase family protein [Candidatus Latescibacterota bacterium]
MTAGIEKGIVSRCDDVYECFPDLTMAQDGGLYLIAHIHANGQGWRMFSWRSFDAGATWDGPQDVVLKSPAVVSSLTQLADGRLLLGLVIDTKPGGNPKESYRPAVFFSDDSGKTWSKPTMLPANDDYLPDEVSVVELDDGTLVGFGRNYALEMKGRPNVTACKVISKDGGRTWAGPFDTWLVGCTGRPKAALLHSGEVCITYRCGTSQ